MLAEKPGHMKDIPIPKNKKAKYETNSEPIQRLIHPTQSETDHLLDGHYDIVFNSGGCYIGTIKNGCYYEGKYIYPGGKETSMGLFNNRLLQLRNGVYEDVYEITEGTFINNKAHGKNMKRTYKLSGIVYEGEMSNNHPSLKNKKEPLLYLGKFIIPESLNLSHDPITGHWMFTYKSGSIKSIQCADINKNFLVNYNSKEIVEWSDGCVFDDFEKTVTYPNNFTGLKKWSCKQLIHWADIKFSHIKNFSNNIDIRNINGETLLKMSDDHFKEIYISGIDLLTVRNEMNKI